MKFKSLKLIAVSFTLISLSGVFGLPIAQAGTSEMVHECVCEFIVGASTSPTRKLFTGSEWVTEATTPSENNCQVFCSTLVSKISSATLLSATYTKHETDVFEPVVPILGVEIPGLEFSTPTKEGERITINFIGEYIAAIYRWLIGVAVVFAVVMVIVGGIQYMIAGGSKQGVTVLKERVGNALIGLVLLLGSYVILYTTNPQLTLFRTMLIDQVATRPTPFAGPGIMANPALAKTEEQFRSLRCPSENELKKGVEFFATAYYKPAHGESGPYQSFECNIAMQCSCPPGKQGREETCTSSVGNWAPCLSFDADVPYCTATSSGRVPEAYVSAAASTCIPRGTLFKVFDSGHSQATSATWRADDTGGWIHGRRIDMFIGTGQAALDQARGISGKVIVKICPDNDPANCPAN